MKIICFGINKRGTEILKLLISKGYDIVAVVSENKEVCNDFIDVGKSNLIPILTPVNINSDESYEKLLKFNADVFFIISYNQILKNRIISLPKLGVFNCHGGKLPEYRGSSVLNWQIINGESEIGISIIKIDKGIDSGSIAKEAKFKISINDDINYVTDKSIELFKELVIDLLKDLNNNKLKLIPQEEKNAVYYCKRTASDGKIDWKNMTDIQIHNLVRALNKPTCPGAYCFYNNEKLIIWKTELLDESIISIQGKIALFRNKCPIVMAKNRCLKVLDYETQNQSFKKIIRTKYFS